MEPDRNITVTLDPEDGTVWCYMSLGPDWVVYARVVADEGRPAIAELRVIPAPPPQAMSEHAVPQLVFRVERRARSESDLRSLRVEEWPVPAAGLPTRRLREVALQPFVEAAQGAVAKFVESGYASASTGGFDAEAAPRKPGRKGRPDGFYADIARRYVSAIDAGSRHPVVDVGRELNRSATQIRDLLTAARRRSLLTAAPAGRYGGQLTEKAIQALQVPKEAKQ